MPVLSAAGLLKPLANRSQCHNYCGYTTLLRVENRMLICCFRASTALCNMAIRMRARMAGLHLKLTDEFHAPATIAYFNLRSTGPPHFEEVRVPSSFKANLHSTARCLRLTHRRPPTRHRCKYFAAVRNENIEDEKWLAPRIASCVLATGIKIERTAIIMNRTKQI